MKGGQDRNGTVAVLMSSMPKKISPSPIRATPHCLTLSAFPTRSMRKPTAIISRPYLWTSKAMIWAVTVVPTLAPMITPMAWLRLNRPVETKATTRTVVADEDWITAVVMVPARAAVNRFLVRRPRRFFMPPPATVVRASVMRCIP